MNKIFCSADSNWMRILNYPLAHVNVCTTNAMYSYLERSMKELHYIQRGLSSMCFYHQSHLNSLSDCSQSGRCLPTVSTRGIDSNELCFRDDVDEDDPCLGFSLRMADPFFLLKIDRWSVLISSDALFSEGISSRRSGHFCSFSCVPSIEIIHHGVLFSSLNRFSAARDKYCSLACIHWLIYVLSPSPTSDASQLGPPS